VLSEKTFEIMFGDAAEGAITISANTFPDVYYIEGETFARDLKTGKDEIFRFIVPKAKILSENTLTMEAEGDPTVFDMQIRVLRGQDGTMMKMVIGEMDIKTGVVGNTVTWTLGDQGTLTFTGEGDIPDYED
jgi:hypothetical protein